MLNNDEYLEKRKWVRLTRVCNNHCLFCLDEEAQNGTILPLTSIIKDLEQGLKEVATRAVLSGGDPTVHPEFLKIIKIANMLGYKHIQAISNGRMFCYADFLNTAVKNGLSEITFSIHANTAELNDKLTGVKGSFVQSLAALKNALSVRGLIVNCDIVVNKLNVDTLAEHLEFLYSLGVREFDLLHIMPFGRAWKYWKELYYNPFKRKKVLFKAFELRKKEGVHLWTNRFPAELFEGAEELIQSPSKLADEIRGRSLNFEALRRDKPMPCSGERCKYCVLKQFCKDFVELRDRGVLYAYPQPQCLGGKKDGSKIKSSATLAEIADFFIKKRHFIKSSNCCECMYNKTCLGVSIDFVKDKGFDVLISYKE